MKFKKGYLCTYLTIFVVVTGFMFLINIQTTRLLSNDKIYKIVNYSLDGSSDDLHYRLLEEGQRLFKFKTIIPESKLPATLDGNYKIIIHRLAGQWYRVYINDVLIGSLGDIKKGYSNIWNAFGVYDLDQDLLQERNELVIEVYGLYEVGLLGYPVMITDNVTANRLSNWFIILIRNIKLVAIGVLLTAFIILILLIKMSKKIKREYVYYALGAFTIIFMVLDYQVMYRLPVPPILFKKFIISGIYLASFFISIGLYKQFKVQLNLVLGLMVLGSAGYLIIFPGNMVDFKKSYSLLNLLISLNVLGWFYAGALNFKKSLYARVFSICSFVLFVLASCDIYHILMNRGFVISMSIIGVAVFSIGIVFLIIIDYIIMQGQVVYEKKKSRFFYEKSIRDSMTGIYNHHYIVSTLSRMKEPFSLVVLDLDNFKNINDTYGHLAGDEVIKNVAINLQNSIRKYDYVGRYGGDEFVIILMNCSLDELKMMAKKIKRAVEEPVYKYKGNKIRVTASMGIYNATEKEEGEQVIYRADQALYAAKKSGRSGIKMWTKSEFSDERGE
ncbi:GGDEF domain-containing protein [Halothermothrix orenii]|uniref:Diguanylate cyclase n=1 Tax=Halothermothrix orenii (strain H 168 / OCM 544 / DSM 9562) TaxID=373903 RepID=B8D1T3_HALOH|nr:GGDEF domain-containing protein [Halothermothrix orenii]ACL69160.1 diguanylate cyclase [Halothermothrix orenii H 168]